MKPLTSKPEDQAQKNAEASLERASKIPMGRYSKRALDKFVSHSDRCGASHIKDLIALGSRFADERTRELCLAL